MSHFVTLVVIEPGTKLVPTFDGKNIPSIIEEILAPFQENNMGDCPREYLAFNDQEDEMLKEYEEDGQEKVVMPDGRLLSPSDNEFRTKDEEGKPNIFQQAEIPKELKRRTVPFKETYATFEDFAKEWHGIEKRDETYNRYGYWENPNAKWDWFEIGGRWAGYFQLKEGCTGVQGKQYNMTHEYKKSEKADVCFNKDIDWERMRNEAAAEAKEKWEIVNKAWEGLPELEPWDSIRERHGSENVEAARKEYWAQPRVKALQTKGLREKLGWMESCERYQVPLEQHLQRSMDSVGVSFALIIGGKWYEQGRMGWWGMATDEKDPETWNSMFRKMIDELPPDAIIAAVDCHI